MAIRGPSATLVMDVEDELMDKFDVVETDRKGGAGCRFTSIFVGLLVYWRIPVIGNGEKAMAQAGKMRMKYVKYSILLVEIGRWEAVSYTHLDVYKRQP